MICHRTCIDGHERCMCLLPAGHSGPCDPNPRTPHDTLARFGAAMLKAMHAAAGHDLSAQLVEAAALDAAVLVMRIATEPCGSDCVCARLTTFPQECLTGPPEIIAAIVAMEMEYP